MCRKVLDYCHQIPHLRSGLRSLVGGEGRVEDRRFHGSTGEQEFIPTGMGLLRLGSRPFWRNTAQMYDSWKPLARFPVLTSP